MNPSLRPHHPQCPQPPASRESTHARTLHRACVILGGLAPLAAHLGVPDEQLRAWMEGKEPAPEAVFVAALEVVLLHLEGRGAPQ